MKILGVCISFSKPMELSFLFKNRLFQLHKFYILNINIMKFSSILFRIIMDNLIFSCSDPFFKLSNRCKYIPIFSLGSSTESSEYSFDFLIKPPHRISINFSIPAASQCIQKTSIFNPIM